MIWKKPDNLKYTDLCIYIDENAPKIKVPGEHPEIEDTIYNYLWLIVKALSIKKRMFNDFKDYDTFSFHAANRLFFAIRKSYVNEGKKIKGKVIKPIKSCLNYMKAIMYPMKLEFQNETYNEVITAEYVSKKFDSFTMHEKLKDSARINHSINEKFKGLVYDTFKDISSIIDEVLANSVYTQNSINKQRLKITILLNCIQSIKNKNKLTTNGCNIILWKLPKSTSGYVKIVLEECYVKIKQEIMSCYEMVDLDESTLNNIIASSRGIKYDEH